MGHVEEVGASSHPSISPKCRGVPGATSSPSRACRADDNSPNTTNISALAARLSKSSPSCCRRFLLLAAASSSHLELASNKEFHSPLANTSNLSRSFSFEINPPRGGRCNNIRGIKRKSFHPLSWRTTSSLDASSKANRRAFLNGPFKQWGTLFITEARFFNLSVKFQSSTRRNAPLRATGRGN